MNRRNFLWFMLLLVSSSLRSQVSSCGSNQILTSYYVGAVSATATTGSITNPANASGVIDGTTASMPANAALTLDMGSTLSVGTILTVTYQAKSSTANKLEVLGATSAGGPFTSITQLNNTTAMSSVTIPLPANVQFVQLKTAGTGYNIDAVTYTVYTCVANPAVSCTNGQLATSYPIGAITASTGTGTVTNAQNTTGTIDGKYATINANSSLLIDMGSAIAAGKALEISHYANNTSAPVQVWVASGSSGPYVYVGSLNGATSVSRNTVTLPIATQYVKLITTGTIFYVDAITYPFTTCVAPPVAGCSAANQLAVSYPVGASSVVSTTGTVNNQARLTGVSDGSTAGLTANSSAILDLGTSLAKGSTLTVAYKSNNTTAPMQVLVAGSQTGPFTNIAQLTGSTGMVMRKVVLPIDAQYIQLQTTSTVFNVDAVTYPLYTCVNDPKAICTAGQKLVTTNAGATSVTNTTGSVSTPNASTGLMNGVYATVTGTLTVNWGSVVTAGNTLAVRYYSADAAAPMQVLVATNSGGPYTNIGQLMPSLSAVTGDIVLPVDAQYVRLQATGTTYSIDAVQHPVYSCSAATTTSGQVYFDANINGRQETSEIGLGGVTVKAYDATGNLVATTTTSSTTATLGYYEFSNLTVGQPYRLEFSNWPSQYSPSAFGVDNGSIVQFVQGATSSNDLGLYIPSTVCSFQDNPRLVYGTGQYSSNNSIGSWDYLDRTVINNLGSSSTKTADITSAQVGVPLGIASQRPTNWIYFSPISTNMSSVFPMAPDGASAIYIANYNGPNGEQSYQGSKFLVKLSDLGINVGSVSTTLDGNPFGLQGLGGLDFSQSGDTLYVVNMAKGTLVGVDVSKVDYNNLPTTAPSSAFEITPPISLANCSGGTYRPTALKQYGGVIYVGGVCDASISNNAADLKGVVLTYNPGTNIWSQALSYPINFCGGGKGCGTNCGSTIYYCPTPWSSHSGGASDRDLSFQPVMLDLAFTDNGAMVIGTTNRLVYGAATSDFQTGYILGAWPNGNGTYTLENAGKLGPLTTQVPANYKVATSGPTGPGRDWFFAQRTITNSTSGGSFAESTRFLYNGGLYVKPGTGELVFGTVNPLSIVTAGAAYISTTTGAPLYGAQLFSGQKLSRITGVDEVCDASPPIEIGNRVWKDTNNNGIQDPGEPSLVGVTVELRNAAGGLIATAITDTNGNYIFSNQPNLISTPSRKYGLAITQLTDYKLVISSLGSDPSTAGLTLSGVTIAPGETTGSTNTGATLVNNDAFVVNGLPTITFKSPVDGLINHSYDFGFIGATFDLALKKTLASGQVSTVKPGDKVNFTIKVYNQGKITARNIQVSDYIPTGMVFNASDNAGWTSSSATLVNTTLTGPLSAGDSTSVNIVLQVSSTFTGTSLINKAEISSAKDGSGNTVTDIDSTPDQNASNDAGGKENTTSDNALNGNGKGTPGGTDPTTDEDDADPAIVMVDQCVNSKLAAGVVLSPKAIRSQNDVVQITFGLTNPGAVPLSGITFVGQVKPFNRPNATPVTLTLTKQGDVNNDGIMNPNELWLYTGSFSSTYTPGTVFVVTGEATASCGSATIKAATADLLYTVGVNMDVVKGACATPGSSVSVDLVTRLLIDEDMALNPGSITVGGIHIILPKRRFEARELKIRVEGVNNNQPFDPFNPPSGVSITRLTDQGNVDGGRNTSNILDESEAVNTYRGPCTGLGQNDVECDFPDWVFRVQVPIPANYSGSSFTVTASDDFKLYQSVEDPAGSGTFKAFEEITPTSGAGGSDSETVSICTSNGVTDLRLSSQVSKQQVRVGEEIEYTIKVWNESSIPATGVEVADSLLTGFQYVSSSATRGTYSPSTSRWVIGNIGANGDTVTLRLRVKVLTTGVLFNKAEIVKLNEQDLDSTPGNGQNGEDDQSRVCTTVVIELCTGEKVQASVPLSYTNVKWYRNGQPVASGNVVLLSEVGVYTYTAQNNTCPASGCCPIVIEAGTNCCPVQLCVPFTVKKLRI